jgi:hypothetical protein
MEWQSQQSRAAGEYGKIPTKPTIQAGKKLIITAYRVTNQ